MEHAALGDMLIDVMKANCRNFRGIKLSIRIVQIQGGFPVLDLAVRGRSLEGRAQGSSGCRREVRSEVMSFHRDRRGTKPAARTPLRPQGYGETGPSSLSPTPANE